MKYKCKLAAYGLTVGNIYLEWCKYPNQFNAVVKNDNGMYTHYERNKHFDVIGEYDD